MYDELAMDGVAIVLLDEVETLAVSRHRLSLEANPVDVHRATDAALAGMDRLTREHRNVLLIATTNFLSSFENNRYAFPSDPLYVALLGLCVRGGVVFFRGKTSEGALSDFRD